MKIEHVISLDHYLTTMILISLIVFFVLRVAEIITDYYTFRDNK